MNKKQCRRKLCEEKAIRQVRQLGHGAYFMAKYCDKHYKEYRERVGR